ncbi:aspartate--tRNA ligase msd1 [Orobanche gracilis]
MNSIRSDPISIIHIRSERSVTIRLPCPESREENPKAKKRKTYISDFHLFHFTQKLPAKSAMALRTLITRKTLKPSFLGFRGLQTLSLPDLPYDYGALEPAISADIMQIHHQKHHQAYITNYNKALEQLDGAITKGDPVTVVKLQSAIKFNGGGHVNHSLFWKNLAPVREGGGDPPKGSFGLAIDNNFGSLDALIQKMNAEGAALQGSGWVWLGFDKELKRLVVETTANQDPLVTKGPSLVPLLGIDVWEHAYYLQYKNVKPDYLKNIWKTKLISHEFLKLCPRGSTIPRLNNLCQEDTERQALYDPLDNQLPRISFPTGKSSLPIPKRPQHQRNEKDSYEPLLEAINLRQCSGSHLYYVEPPGSTESSVQLPAAK